MGGSGTQTIRYAPHIESAHKRAMDESGGYVISGSLFRTVGNLLGQSTYKDFEYYDIDDGFLGRIPNDPERTYEIRGFPSLFDMFGKFMAGLDVHVLWAQTYEDVIHGPEIVNSVSAHSAILRHETETNVLPQYLAGMRDINAIQSTTFVIGKSLIAASEVRSINDFQSRIRLAAVELSIQLWNGHLNWSRGVVQIYAEMMKLYYATRMDVDKDHLEYKTKDRLWDLALFDDVRAMIGALNGAAAAQQKKEPSQAVKAIAGTLSGAAAGAAAGGPYGAAIGAVLGLGSSFM